MKTTNKRKFLLAILILMATLCMCAVASAAIVDSGYCGSEGDGSNLTWTLDDTGLLTITGNGEMDNYEYYSDNNPAPWYHLFITRVKINSGVTGIGNSAFYYCTSLTGISIPNTVTSIRAYAFDGCSSLPGITIPGSVTSIGARAFEVCTALTDITIPNSVTSIGQYAFSGCSSMTSIVLPNGLTTIQASALASCDSLTSITIPKGVTRIEFRAFSGCSGLQNVYYGGSEEDREKIFFDSLNESLENATWYYYSCGPDTTTITAAEINAVKDQVYTGKKITPAVTVKYNGKKLKAGTHYTLSYRNNKNIGKATILVKGKGRYGGNVEISFNIVPKAVQLTSLKVGKNKLTIKWNKGSGITGYELQYSLDKKFRDAETVTVTKAGKTSINIMNLITKKTYYVRIRTYRNIKGVLYYSAWSKAKKAIVK